MKKENSKSESDSRMAPMVSWNPWHGCHKISEGCRHCYVYREDAAFGTATPANVVRRTASFSLPLKRDRHGKLKYPAGTMFALCFTSDLLLEEADKWRKESSYLLKNGRIYRIPRSYQHSQARKAGLNTNADYEKSLREDFTKSKN